MSNVSLGWHKSREMGDYLRSAEATVKRDEADARLPEPFACTRSGVRGLLRQEGFFGKLRKA